jgi:hypothetical protein
MLKYSCSTIHLLAVFAVGGLAGVATQVTVLSAADLLCGRLQDGWHKGAERPKMELRSMILLSCCSMKKSQTAKLPLKVNSRTNVHVLALT